MKKLLLIVLLFSSLAHSQNGGYVSPSSSSGGFVYVGALSGIPATCTVSQLAFITDATAGKNIYECASTNTWTQQLSGSGTPGGSSGNIQVDNAGAFDGVTGSSYSNAVTLGSGSISDLALNGPTVTTGNASNSYHLLDLTSTFNVGSLGTSTQANIYSVLNNNSTGGTFGHQLGIVSRTGDNSTGSTITDVSAFYASYGNGAAATSNPALVIGYDSSDWTLNRTTVGVLTGFNFGVALPTGTGAITKQNGALFGVPASTNAGLSQFEGLNVGNCDPITGNTYVGAQFCGAEVDFKTSVNHSLTLNTAAVAPMTDTQTFGEKYRLEGDANTNFIGIDMYAFSVAGGTTASWTGINILTDMANTGTMTTQTAGQFKYRNSGNGTITTAYGLHILAPDNSSGTVTQGYGLKIDDLAVGTNTNAPIAIDSSNLIRSKSYGTATNCSSSASPAVCGSAAAGSVVIAASATTVTVNTTAVTANSQIFIQPDDSLGTKLGVTCNTTGTLLDAEAWVSARTAATSFVITVNAAPSVNPECFSYFIVN